MITENKETKNEESSLYIKINKSVENEIEHSKLFSKKKYKIIISNDFVVETNYIPNRLNRFFIKILFGWRYENN